ncbi:MAG: hypothetical protein AAF889_07040 [Cyanobacteria bacterium P01_D01_bin.73]
MSGSGAFLEGAQRAFNIEVDPAGFACCRRWCFFVAVATLLNGVIATSLRRANLSLSRADFFPSAPYQSR